MQHIFNTDARAYRSDSKLIQINIGRNKKLLLEYLDIVIKGFDDSDNLKELPDSNSLYKNYIRGIGEFMNRHFAFSFSGGGFMYLAFLLWATLGASIDLALWVTTRYSAYYFLLGGICFGIARYGFKKAQKKLYGPNY